MVWVVFLRVRLSSWAVAGPQVLANELALEVGLGLGCIRSSHFDNPFEAVFQRSHSLGLGQSSPATESLCIRL